MLDDAWSCPATAAVRSSATEVQPVVLQSVGRARATIRGRPITDGDVRGDDHGLLGTRHGQTLSERHAILCCSR
jgi:hypothetical protein